MEEKDKNRMLRAMDTEGKDVSSPINVDTTNMNTADTADDEKKLDNQIGSLNEPSERVCVICIQNTSQLCSDCNFPCCNVDLAVHR